MKMDEKIFKIATELKENISVKYKLIDFRVFGSTARGSSQDRESDIDIFVILERVDRKIEEELFDIAYDMELKYDCLIDLIVFGKDALNGRISYAPVYVRAMEEGIVI
jgi:predicted nucleotidyltransferase